MNFLQKQLVLNSGRTLYEESKIPCPGNALDMSRVNVGEPAPHQHVYCARNVSR